MLKALAGIFQMILPDESTPEFTKGARNALATPLLQAAEANVVKSPCIIAAVGMSTTLLMGVER